MECATELHLETLPEPPDIREAIRVREMARVKIRARQLSAMIFFLSRLILPFSFHFEASSSLTITRNLFGSPLGHSLQFFN